MAVSTSLAQQMLYAARILLISGKAPGCHPGDRFSINLLSDLFPDLGPDVLIPAPAYALDVFHSFTSEIILQIRALYCSRELRNWEMVAEIVNRMRRKQGMSPLPLHGIWATCVFMNDLRLDRTFVSVNLLDEEWGIIAIHPPVTIHNGEEVFHPSITCIICRQTNKVVGFSIVNQNDLTQGIDRAIYQALVSRRIPSFDAVAGVLWSLPKLIITEVELPPESLQILAEQGVDVVQGAVKTELANYLRENWYRDLRFRDISIEQLYLIFDNFLEQIFSHAPILDLSLYASQHRTQVGYNRDPLWQFPALRNLLPRNNAVIDGRGFACLGYRKYYSADLLYWPDESVFLTISPYDKTLAWIYANTGQVICRATME